MDLYSRYVDCINNWLRAGELPATFKSIPEYRYMLEHVSYEEGNIYFNLLKDTPIPYEYIKNFCKMNDGFGNPTTHVFNDFVASPTSLRYIYHAHLILTYFSKLKDEISIVELGGGYGGLYLCIDYMSKFYNVKIKKYTIIDLVCAISLQSVYVSKFQTKIPLQLLDSNNYGSELSSTENLCLISCYCFSEIDMTHQRKYIETLFPHVSHGFIVWNNIPVYNFGFKLNISFEPFTEHSNRYVYF
jgi:hypothetical protein